MSSGNDAGRSGSERGTSQHSESSRREEAEGEAGRQTRGRTDHQVETGQDAHESSTGSRRKG